MEENKKILQIGQQSTWELHTCLQEQNSTTLGRLLPLQLGDENEGVRSSWLRISMRILPNWTLNTAKPKIKSVCTYPFICHVFKFNQHTQ